MKMTEQDDRIGKWLSAALEDPATCAEMKADIRAWFDSRAVPQTLPDRDTLWATIAKHIDCEKDCQRSPDGCGCAMAAADAILALSRPEQSTQPVKNGEHDQDREDG